MQPNEDKAEPEVLDLVPVFSEKSDEARSKEGDGKKKKDAGRKSRSTGGGRLKMCVRLPGFGRPFSDFAAQMGQAAQNAIGDKLAATRAGNKEQVGYLAPDPSDPSECFLCIRNGVVGKIFREGGVTKQHSGLLFVAMTPDQAVTELERWIQTGHERRIAGQRLFIPQSMTRATAATLLASSQFQEALPKVERLFDFSIPYGFIQKKQAVAKATKDSGGTSPGIKSNPQIQAQPKLAGEIRRMRPGFDHYRQKNEEIVRYYCNSELDHYLSLDQAKEVIRKLFLEFTFADEQSRIHAIARLLTPYCQGLMGWRKRGPLWIFTADKPRAGKDYLAMLTPLVHSHWAVQDPPLEGDDEVKRRITAALVSGRRFMHFANCRKELDHPSLEAAVTSEFWSDRIIRSSNEATVPNEIIFSLSYNDTLPITHDLVARSRQIRLIGKDGDANAHKYRIDDLHEAVTRFESKAKADDRTQNSLDSSTRLCRRNILAALESLVRYWGVQNCPHGPTFTSYPEWSRIVGGIMLAAGLGNPCQRDESLIAATADDWKDDLLKLAEIVCLRNEKEFFNTADFLERFITPRFDDFPMFKAYCEQYELRGFSIQLGKYLKRNSGKSLFGKQAIYVVRPHEFRNPPRYQVIITKTNAAAVDPSPENHPNTHLDEYLLVS